MCISLTILSRSISCWTPCSRVDEQSNDTFDDPFGRYKYFFLIISQIKPNDKQDEIHSIIFCDLIQRDWLCFQTDESIRHGPHFAYSENVFEKRQGVIRAKLLHQENQLSKSRDTAVMFRKSYLFQPVLMGGGGV